MQLAAPNPLAPQENLRLVREFAVRQLHILLKPPPPLEVAHQLRRFAKDLPARRVRADLQERADQNVREDATGPIVDGQLDTELRIGTSGPLHRSTAQARVPGGRREHRSPLPLRQLQEPGQHGVPAHPAVVYAPAADLLRQVVEAGAVQGPAGVATVVDERGLRALRQQHQSLVHVGVGDDPRPRGVLAIADIRRGEGSLAKPLSGVLLSDELHAMAAENEEQLVPAGTSAS
mmetsp:Transcript_102971/g.315017  ORF Transcript_102971/g.315017 Transcript_102971/m.315017 type:complete len:233 (+) Transcript_102971:98-796(+)